MLTLSRFRLRFERVGMQHLEIVRRGRNRDFVRQNHIYRKRITKAEQLVWFNKVNSPDSYYFVISKQDRPIAAAHMRAIDTNLRRADYGLFVWDQRYHGSTVPVFITLLMLDFFFVQIGIDLVEGVILAGNKPIRKICEFFHFSFRDSGQPDQLITYSTRENYMQRRGFLLEFAKKTFPDENDLNLKMAGEKSPLHLPAVNRLLE